MIELSPTTVMLLMFGGVIVTMIIGYPLSFGIFIAAVGVGYLTLGVPVFTIMYAKVFEILRNYILLAVPLFIYMGAILGSSGLGDDVYNSLYLFFGGLRGSLALITTLVGTIFAACTGVMSASVSMLAIIALPPMLKRGYDKPLACGTVCAAGSLGILIPPSVMLVVYGPMAGISVGQLFMGAFMPGFLLSALYCSYILLLCYLKPKLAPVIPVEERGSASFIKKTSMLVVSLFPPIVIIMSVLGVIFLGIAAPTEAAAVGGLTITILVAAYRKLNWQIMKEAVRETLTFTSRGLLIAGTSIAFTAVFLRLGGGDVVQAWILGVPGGRWGAFTMVMFIYFILGFFVDWIGIFFIMVPILAPLAPILGFDPLWFGLMICINLQTSFMTPPFAAAIYYLRGIAPPAWGIETVDMIKGCIPFVVLILACLVLCIALPELILWLPSLMVK